MKKQPKEKLSFLKNLEIKAFEVRVTSEEGSPIMKLRDAVKLAEERDEDVILLNGNAEPPVVRIMEYSKYVYQQKKLIDERKKNSKAAEMKEVRFSVNIDSNDLKVKVGKIDEFIKGGHKVKCSLLLKGRQNANPTRGQLVMLNVAQMMEDVATPESVPKMEGKKWLMILKPNKK